METDQVAGQQPLEQMLFDRQGAPKVTSWEWSMEEKPDGTMLVPLLQSIAEQLRQQHQMIIMHPDQGSRLGRISHRIGKQLVDPSICLPGPIFINHTGLIMEDGPQDSIYTRCQVSAFTCPCGVRAYWRTCYNVRALVLCPRIWASHHVHPSSVLPFSSPRHP